MAITSLDLLVCFATAILLVFVHFLRSRKSTSGLPYPPGPPGWPVLGNIFNIPRGATWLTYMKWGRIHGEFTTVAYGHFRTTYDQARTSFT